MNAISILQNGEITVEGQFLWGSNYTLLVDVVCEDAQARAVYKPTQGVRPLWDFDAPTLARREVMAHLVSEHLGWELVPPTYYRKTGPMGPGSLQLFIEHDPEHHFFTFSPEDRQRLRPAALFDILINNADRKGGHFIVDSEDHIWLIDHGVCFHEEPKLRTVLWDFADEPIPDDLLSQLTGFLEAFENDGAWIVQLQRHLSAREITALKRRTERLLALKVFPAPHKHVRPYPWPLV